MKWFLVVYLCSQVQSVCIDPHVLPEPYDDQYTCLVDGYKKSYEKMSEIKHFVLVNIDILPKTTSLFFVMIFKNLCSLNSKNTRHDENP
jgi:hypothetical protein